MVEKNRERAAGLAEAPPHYFGHRERLRERFREAGTDALSDYELLELLLFRAQPRRDMKPIAKALLEKFGSFTWPEILAHETTPQATRTAAAPATIRVSYELRGVARCDEITADGRPFGLERVIDGKRSYLFFPGIEADCGTEPIDAGDPERASISKKFCAYLAAAEQGLHRSHFGFPNFLVPFITTSNARMRSMMELLDRLTDGSGSKIILFKTFPSLISAEQPPAPSGQMLTEPWQRDGFPSLCLDR